MFARPMVAMIVAAAPDSAGSAAPTYCWTGGMPRIAQIATKTTRATVTMRRWLARVVVGKSAGVATFIRLARAS